MITMIRHSHVEFFQLLGHTTTYSCHCFFDIAVFVFEIAFCWILVATVVLELGCNPKAVHGTYFIENGPKKNVVYGVHRL